MSRFVRASKYRHVFGKAEKKENCYQNVRLSKNAWDSNYIKANTKYFAVCWETGGGAVAVVPHEQRGKLPQANFPIISGHSGSVLDLDWHPFNESLLATVSEDCYAKIWGIPEGGLTESIEEPLQSLRGHKRKIGTCNFNPVANNVLATSSGDLTVKVWDIEKGDEIYQVDGHTDLIQSLTWNDNGSQIITSCKDKKLRVIDPRAKEVVQTVASHQGVKGSRVCYLNGKEKIFTVGFSRTSEREFNIWDPKNMEKEIHHTNLDSASGILMPFYDEDTTMLYLAGKGDGNIRYYEIVDEKPFIYALSEYKSSTPQRGMALVPKRALNVSECEVARVLKLMPSEVEPISFKVPRKSDLFQDDIFPPAFSGEYSLTTEQWVGGENAEQKRVSLEGGFVAPEKKQEFNPTVKEEEKPLSEKELKEELEKLKNRVSYLEAEIVKKDAKIAELSA